MVSEEIAMIIEKEHTHTHTYTHLFVAYHFLHGIGEHKGCSLSLYPQFVLEIAQNVSEINVKVVAKLGHHEVIIVSIAQAKHVAGHAVRGCRDDEVASPLSHFCFLDFLVFIIAHSFVCLQNQKPKERRK